ncbi:leucine-rich repeat domain-containing protein [Acinetobacter sp. YH16057]|uniref:leucine-rich repeat domain-containing protein n=1 Tax=Acinetobacter sp. YH16057 TaxID=2601195 RepID=UPI0015D3BC16|nr:leucine-rich repeat domain-containing protein [Acinetobacter sp. YH16057]
MATYTGVADANGDFNISFGSNEYNSGEKITVTAEKDSATKSIELYAPSEPVPPVSSEGISFTGALNDFPNNIGRVVLSGMDTIAAQTFRGDAAAGFIWTRATGLEIKEGITSIGSNAFQGWTAATDLTIPFWITNIGVAAFYGWINATSLNIQANITSISNTAFQGWTKCLSITIPATVTSIGTSAFHNLYNCNEITIHALTPPTITTSTFTNLKSTCVFRVPAASVAAYQAAANWSAFAARIQAI